MMRELAKVRMNNQKGFTLVELMIVVAIIGILAAIAIPQFAAYRERSWVASMQADAKNFATAEEAYFAENSAYTDVNANLVVKESPNNTVAITVVAGPPETFSIAVTSTKTNVTVDYDSTTGEIITTP